MPISRDEIWQSIRPLVARGVQQFVQPGGRWYNSTDQSIPNSAWTWVSFDSVVFDPFGIKTAATDFTVTVPGVYSLGCTLKWAANGTGMRGAGIAVGGTNIIETLMPNTGAGSVVELNLATLWRVDSTTVFHALAYQDTGGPLNVRTAVASGIANNPVFWITRVGA